MAMGRTDEEKGLVADAAKRGSAVRELMTSVCAQAGQEMAARKRSPKSSGRVCRLQAHREAKTQQASARWSSKLHFIANFFLAVLMKRKGRVGVGMARASAGLRVVFAARAAIPVAEALQVVRRA